MRSRILPLIAAAFAATGCESIYENQGDCSVRYQVAFKYTMNVVGADAFANKVKSISVFVFDTDGKLVTSKTEAGEALATGNYAMELDVKPGTYDIVAWGGMQDGSTWMLAGGSTPKQKQELGCSLRLTGEDESRQQLTDLFHGTGRVTFPADVYGTYTAEQSIDLTKDNNRLRVILQHYNGRQMDKDDFSFKVTDDNATMEWDNSVTNTGKTITYREHTKQEALVGVPVQARADDEITSITSVVAEIDIARLMADHKPVLTVEVKGKDKPVLSLPLIDLLLNAKGAYRSNQEFLDRQDDYNLIFYLDDAYGWYTKGGVWVNSWHVIFQDKTL